MKILFICTHNRCRSILAEAIANQYGEGLLVAASAGSEPAGVVHPMTLRALTVKGISTTGLHSKSWDELEEFAPDVVVTVCNNAAGEACPLWMGKSLRVHWGLSDPSALPGGEEVMMVGFEKTIQILASKIGQLVGLLKQNADRTQLQLLLKSWQHPDN